MADRHEMNSALARIVVPALKRRGFTGALPHFRRLGDTKTDLLTFQFDRHGGGFVIEVAEVAIGPFVSRAGKAIPAHKLTAYHVNPPGRKRLVAHTDTPGTASWFRYDGSTSPEAVALEALSYIGQLEQWFSGEKRQPNIR